MFFNSLEYACLLIVTVFLSWLFANRHTWRVLVLLTGSYIFYASWNIKYLSLIFLSSSLDYAIGILLSRTDRPLKRKALLAMSMTVNLGVLSVFKYFNFFAREITDLLFVFGLNVTEPHLSILLPVGISFYTFQTMSYTIDLYRKQISPSKSYFDYLLFVSFFPQLVAGPIVRASTLLPQIRKKPRLSAEQGSRALYRIGIGLVKKIAIADFLGTHIVDVVFSNPKMYSSLETLIAVYAYSFQIYADFSAYSDIAIGSAALLGFKIPENFIGPYRAANLREFWQRWHISLSTWLRDYLYIPLGGSRHSSFRTYANLGITMLLGGLWHGAAMTFVCWGAMHGVALMVTRVIQRTGISSYIPRAVQRPIGVFLTFHLVSAAWIFFRSSSFASATQVFEQLADFSFSATNISQPVIAVLAVAVITHWIPHHWIAKTKDLFHAAPAPLQAALLIAAILVIQQVARTDVAPFIYFQF